METVLLHSIVAHAGRAFRPVGAQIHEGGVNFRVWAPNHTAVRVATGDGTATRYIMLDREPGDEAGFFSGRDEHGTAGDLYWYQLDGRLAPDPASRFQPAGVDGPSQVVDPQSYAWQATQWKRPPLHGRVIYELHVGTFTPEGTFLAAIGRLPALAELGVNTIELMPLGDFTGERNWGYDGVMIYSPARCYGTPDELRALVDAAHEHGLAVMVDVVYNHLGPCGNVLPLFSDRYFHVQRGTLWGASLNFDDTDSGPVREFFIQNACMWFDEYRIDGLRLDAVHAIHDSSTPHLAAEIAEAAHVRGGFVVAEDERNDARLITPMEEGGWGIDGMWSDDFHHTVRVAVTGQRHAHLANYSGRLEEWVQTLRDGWFYHGQFFSSWRRERGTPGAHLPPERFVVCTSNHDQVGNQPLGERLSMLVSPEVYRAVSMLGCLLPYTPLLFMGQEWGATTPFPYFCDLPGEVGTSMAQHRLNEFGHYGATYPPEVLAQMPDPQAKSTFAAAKLDWNERERPEHSGVLALYRECLRLRAAHPIFQSAPRAKWKVEKFGDSGIGITWCDGEVEWLLLVSVVSGSPLRVVEEHSWERVLSSNELRFGGNDVAIDAGPGATLWRIRRR
jgi:maltooligosyltrehalose trehalohydrolase